MKLIVNLHPPVRLLILVLAFLVAGGLTTNAQKEELSKALHKAAGKKDLKKLRTLIAKGADVNFLYFGVTPLEDAIQMGRTKVVQVLVNSGANLKTRSRQFNTTPLYNAVKAAWTGIVKILLAKGAKVNVTVPSSGRTPLMESVGEGSNKMEIFKLLLKNGADERAKDKKGMTALDYANKGLQGARKFLESAEKEGDSRKIRRGKRAVKVYEEFVALLKRA